MASTPPCLRTRDDPRPMNTPSQPPLHQPTITNDKGLASLPDDIIWEIFNLIDTEALKSCSLACKALTRSAKPLLHRSLQLTGPRSRGSANPPNILNRWDEFEAFPTLAKRGLLHHTRHMSILLSHSPLFGYGLDPHIQHLRTLTNLKSFGAHWLDTRSFTPWIEKYFGAFSGTLKSLELVAPGGGSHQILNFVCQFPKLRDLKIGGLQRCTSSMTSNGPRFDVKTSPPLDGTLDLQFGTSMGSDSAWMGPQLILKNLITLPSGLKFRTLKLSGYADDNLQPLIDACAPTLERLEFTGGLVGIPPWPPLSFERHPAFQKLGIKLEPRQANTENVARWLAGTLSTITSYVFGELTIYIVPYAASEGQVRGWNSVDTVLDQLNLHENVTLVVRQLHLPLAGDNFESLIGVLFPLMWKKGRVVLEVPPPDL